MEFVRVARAAWKLIPLRLGGIGLVQFRVVAIGKPFPLVASEAVALAGVAVSRFSIVSILPYVSAPVNTGLALH